MPSYNRLGALAFNLGRTASLDSVLARIVDVLVEEWLGDYTQSTPDSEIVETTTEGFSYLFDIPNERLVASWGVSAGRAGHLRDKARMAGHPLSAGSLYHRGHAIPHTLGGGTDINLVPQLGAINIGAFRVLEKQAVATPGSLYFTYWLYDDPESKTPSGVEQGIIAPGCAPDIRRHGN